MSLFGWRRLLGLGVVATALVFGAGNASAAFHGIATTKGCTSPVKIGDPYTCSVQILNVVDTAHDTLRVTGLSDTINSAGGAVTTGNILPSTGLVFSGAVACSGGSGAGTNADPYLGATECLLPFGTSITTKQFSHYTVAANDFNLPNHRLTDTASVNWNNTCTFNPDNDCTTTPQIATAGSSALIEKLPSSTATSIHNAAHQTVTVVEIGSTVHDFVTVTGQPGNPTPGGNVNIDWFLNGACIGAPAVNSGSIGPLNGAGTFDATGFAFTVNSPGMRSFKAHYEGDATYLPSDGDCEPLRVVDANIQLTPAMAFNPVSTNHVLTAHVGVNDGGGAGYVDAPNGTIVTFFLLNFGGATASFVGPNTCTVANGLGTCTVVINSSTSGGSAVRATTTVSVAGIALTRTTGDGQLGDSADAGKRWANDTVRTDIHDSSHNVILSSSPGLVVHDKVFVERDANTFGVVPNPTGTVIFHRYTTVNCTGTPTDETKTVAADGTAESSNFTASGNMSYKAHYNGDANYPARDGACEPLPTNALPCPAGLFVAGTAAGAPGNLNIAYDQFPAPNDNSYGANAVGWTNGSGHSFKALHNSDHAGFQIARPNGSIALSFNIDYITSTAVSAANPSGYASLGPFGGDGGVLTNSSPVALTNDPAKISWDTSLARNLNKTGYFAGGNQVIGKPATAGCDAASAAAGTCSDLKIDSPKTLNTTNSYVLKTPNPWTGSYTNPEYAAMNLTPAQQAQVVSTVNGWNFHNTYFVTLKQAYLTAIGFDFANWTFGPSKVAGKWTVMPNLDALHNSPAKPCPAA